MRRQVNSQYLEWLTSLIDDGRANNHTALLRHLFEYDFRYTHHMDANRLADGLDLRYRFGRENGIDDRIIATFIDDKPASVLEVMVALAVRCEDHIMENSDIGNRTPIWFWGMVDSLGLSDMDDEGYDADNVDFVMERFLDCAYDRDGSGGLFTVHNPTTDMRNLDIWYQMCMFLETIL